MPSRVSSLVSLAVDPATRKSKGEALAFFERRRTCLSYVELVLLEVVQVTGHLAPHDIDHVGILRTRRESGTLRFQVTSNHSSYLPRAPQ